MKSKIITIFVMMLMITTIFVSFPTVTADSTIVLENTNDQADNPKQIDKGCILAQTITIPDDVDSLIRVEFIFDRIYSENDGDIVFGGIIEGNPPADPDTMWDAVWPKIFSDIENHADEWISFSFGGELDVDAGDTYTLLILNLNIDLLGSHVSNDVSNSNIGDMKYWNGDGWSDESQYDLRFKLYGEYDEEPPEYFDLTYDIEGEGTVDLNPPGGRYEEGTEVTLTASPSEGWSFSGWTGDIFDNRNPTTIIMNSDIHTTAHFEEEQTEELNVDAGGMGNGYYVGEIDKPIQFTGSVEGGVGPYTWSWDFDDGKSSSVQNPSHTYKKVAGKDQKWLYTVTLTVRDSKGNTDSDEAKVAIAEGYKNKYALIIRGPPDSWGNGLDDAYLSHSFDNMKSVLYSKGFEIIAYNQPLKSDFNQACLSLKDDVEKNDLLVVVMMGHGVKDGGHKFYLNDYQYESERFLNDEELPNYLNGIKCRQLVVMFSCYSGGFVDDLSKNSNDLKRIVLTSSKSDEMTYAGYKMDWLGNLMLGFLNDNAADYDGNSIVTIEESFRYATNSLSGSNSNNMHPLLDDNGDGEGHSIDDNLYYTVPIPGEDGFYATTSTLDSALAIPGSKQKTIEYPLISRFLSRFPLIQQLLHSFKNQLFPIFQ